MCQTADVVRPDVNVSMVDQVGLQGLVEVGRDFLFGDKCLYGTVFHNSFSLASFLSPQIYSNH